MGYPAAIILGLALIAASIIGVFRYDVRILSEGTVYLVDRLTGAVVLCASSNLVPAKQDCDAK